MSTHSNFFKITRQIIITVLLLVVSLGIFLFFVDNNLKKSSIPPYILKDSRWVKIFKLENNRYISFPLLTLSNEIRIATNAEFSPDMDLRQSSNREPYTIEVQAYNSAGNLVESRVINYSSKTQFYFAAGPGMYLASYFLDSDSLPGETRVARVNFKDTPEIAEVRLKRLDNNQNLSNIYARVYQKAGVSDSRLNFYWLNIMQKDKERLAGANIYPVNMLRKAEQLNLIRNLWLLTTPAGIPDKDFIGRRLYNVNNPQGIPYDINLLHSGNYIDDLHSLIIPVSEDNSDVNIEIISADIIYPQYMKIWLLQPQDKIFNILNISQAEDDITNNIIKRRELQFTRGQKAEIIWRGRGLGKQIRYQESINNRYFAKDYNFAAGSIIINSNAPAYVYVSKKTNDKLGSIVANPTSTSLVALRPDSYVEFEIFHSEDIMPFRLDLRKVSAKIFDVAGLSTVNYELFNTKNEIIASGDINFPTIPTKFDFSVTKQGLYVSDRVKYYFSLTKDVAKIRFKGEEDIYISGYDRANSFTRHYIIPEDYNTSQDKKESLRRTWFFKSPINYDQLKQDLRNIIVKSQNRIIDENQFIKAGIYNWQEILPEGSNWSAVEITEPKSNELASRAEAKGVEFSQILVNQKQLMEFTGKIGEKIVAPTLMYNGKIGSVVIIYADNRELLNTTLTNQNGEINLPNIPVGNHTVLIKSTAPLQAFLNYLKIDQDSVIKHNIVSFKRERQSFIFEKTSANDQIITLKTYSISQNPKRLVVDIEGPTAIINEAIPSYTIRSRKYDISFTRPSDNIKFIDNKQTSLYGAEPVFIKLGSDLAKGKYKINLTAEDYQGFYISLSSLMPGLVDNRSISIEVEDAE